MSFFVIGLGALFTILASAILSYISVATMIGPWIAPTIVLISSVLFRIVYQSAIDRRAQKKLILIQALASGGGIIAVGIGFGLPILYFLDPPVFQNWLACPFHFALSLITLCLCAGSLGIFLGKMFSYRLLDKSELGFPISQLTYQVATSQSQQFQAIGLFKGIISTIGLCIMRDGIFAWKGFLPKSIPLLSAPIIGTLTISLWPTLWAIGYTAGLATAIPLLVGMLAKYFVLYPLNHHSQFLPWALFTPFREESFAMAFCAGLVICEVALYFLQRPTATYHYIKKQLAAATTHSMQWEDLILHPIATFLKQQNRTNLLTNALHRIEPVIALVSFFALFSYLKFSLTAQLIILVATIVACYEMNYISGKIGLLQFGRFSAFILIPAVLLFNINPLQITVLCVFFNVCAAVSSDLLFDYRTGDLAGIRRSTMHLYQWLGLIIAAFSVGFIFYLLFTALPLGSEQLFAHRGRSKALLLQSLNFDGYIVMAGLLFGFLLKKLKISPTMTFGGIIMPSQITLGFVVGGLLSWVVGKKKLEYLPFCSGVFASETLWIIGSIAIKML